MSMTTLAAFIGGLFGGFILAFFCFCIGLAAGRAEYTDDSRNENEEK